MTARRKFAFFGWRLRPDQDGDAPRTTYAFRCLTLQDDDTERAAKSPASEDPTEPQTWVFAHIREFPEHTSYAEVTERSRLAGYWAEVRAEGPVYGTGESVQYVLSTFQTISPVLVLRWLSSEAARIANRLLRFSGWCRMVTCGDPCGRPEACGMRRVVA